MYPESSHHFVHLYKPSQKNSEDQKEAQKGQTETIKGDIFSRKSNDGIDGELAITENEFIIMNKHFYGCTKQTVRSSF